MNRNEAMLTLIHTAEDYARTTLAAKITAATPGSTWYRELIETRDNLSKAVQLAYSDREFKAWLRNVANGGKK